MARASLFATCCRSGCVVAMRLHLRQVEAEALELGANRHIILGSERWLP
jgi:hypothetical protein